eukprot:gnl/TRDRNA2_/TRDRNA2_90009_c0_seq1.p1 gnl/TRDRNA2_/TRDRNA2_90009_c0~~gnl/TRDRNA2_/TRDRNA2_90009_c0_seq1.p1  ORF type:complete len:286 (+),score=28.96 gnl/TRDRNA2_/TRDRNA2_90009_c0_seq1:104-961(+)
MQFVHAWLYVALVIVTVSKSSEACSEFETANEEGQCVCEKGYFREKPPKDECTSDPSGKGSLCMPCEKGFFKGEIGDGDGRCTDKCSLHFGFLASSDAGATSIDDCYCADGAKMVSDASKASGQACFKEAPDPDDQCVPASEGVPEQPDTAARPKEAEMVTYVDKCGESKLGCPPGYFKSLDTNKCIACDQGYFNPGHVADHGRCQHRCSTYFGFRSTSPQAATSLEQCYCIEGSVRIKDDTKDSGFWCRPDCAFQEGDDAVSGGKMLSTALLVLLFVGSGMIAS